MVLFLARCAGISFPSGFSYPRFLYAPVYFVFAFFLDGDDKDDSALLAGISTWALKRDD